jgi:hypothetical protein
MGIEAGECISRPPLPFAQEYKRRWPDRQIGALSEWSDNPSSFPPQKPVITASMTDFRSAQILGKVIETMIIRIIGPAFRAA